MKTKKVFLGLSLLAIAGLWTGCSNDDEVFDTSGNGQAISFRTQGGAPQLRATETTSDHIDAFVVYGTDNERAKDQLLGNIFNRMAVTRQVDGGSNNIFSYSPKKYYTQNATTAQFAAFSPISRKIKENTIPSQLFDKAISFDYTVVAPLADGKTAQEDLLVTGTTVKITKDLTDPVDPSSPEVNPWYSTVTLNFKHALSRIFVQATSELSETVTIRELTLLNLKSEGTITGTPPISPDLSSGPAPWTWEWSGQKTVLPYHYILPASGVSVEAGTTSPVFVISKEQGMMLLPQKTDNKGNDATADDFALKVVYDISNLGMQEEFVFLEDGYEFEMGSQYVITINFHTVTDLIEIGFKIEVEEFDEDDLTNNVPPTHDQPTPTPPAP